MLYVSDQGENMTFLESALAHSSCVLSVMGDHAGESTNTIFNRKIADINRLGKTFWLMRSPKARPAQVQRIAPSFTIFIEPATKGGARPTKEEDVAKEYSNDGESWYLLPKDLSPVTGKLDKGAAALVFDKMIINVTGSLDLWNYAEYDLLKPIKFILGCSTVCAIKRDMAYHSDRMKSRHRGIVAVARLAEPYCVWVR